MTMACIAPAHVDVDRTLSCPWQVVEKVDGLPVGVGGRGVRGRTKPQTSMLAFIDPESRIPAKQPLRTIKQFADAALTELSPEFDRLETVWNDLSLPRAQRTIRSISVVVPPVCEDARYVDPRARDCAESSTWQVPASKKEMVRPRAADGRTRSPHHGKRP